MLAPDSINRHLAETVARYSQIPGVRGVLLGGSLSEDACFESSDIDIFVVYDDQTVSLRSLWEYKADGAMLDIHAVPESIIDNLSRLTGYGQSISFAREWLKSGCLEQLCVHRTLWIDWRSTTKQALDRIVSSRENPELRSQLAAAALERARSIAINSSWLFDRKHELDGLLARRQAYQWLMSAAQIKICGSYFGCKRRPEWLRDARASDIAQDIYEALRHDCGLSLLTREFALKLAKKRHAFRDSYVEQCESISTALGESARQHEQNATDYYEPLIMAGFEVGAMNHMANISGLRKVPRRLMAAVSPGTSSSIATFLSSPLLSSEFRKDWLNLVGITLDEHQGEVGERFWACHDSLRNAELRITN